MKIASSSMEMASSHVSQQTYERSERLRMWTGSRGRDPEVPKTHQSEHLPSSQVQISLAGATAQSNEAQVIQQGIDATENDPILLLLRRMIALLTGEEVKVFHASDLTAVTASTASMQQSFTTGVSAQTASSGFGLTYDYHETYDEFEQTSFAASGVVHTSDGAEINFNLSLTMTRSFHTESSTSLQLGDARQRQDPLVLNFGGVAAQLTNQRFNFDLNSDGSDESINFATGGSGFLAFDRNGDGKINNGSELFGTATGNGFGDLAQLDSDRNGWIDENDAAYSELRIWRKDSDGEDHLSTLKESGVGAIALLSTSTPFAQKDGANNLIDQVRRSGLFLQENGQTGTIQQIDLTI